MGGVGCGLYTGGVGCGGLVVVADCSIVVVCTHGVCVVRVRFPAVRLGAWVFAEVCCRKMALHTTCFERPCIDRIGLVMVVSLT